MYFTFERVVRQIVTVDANEDEAEAREFAKHGVDVESQGFGELIRRPDLDHHFNKSETPV